MPAHSWLAVASGVSAAGSAPTRSRALQTTRRACGLGGFARSGREARPKNQPARPAERSPILGRAGGWEPDPCPMPRRRLPGEPTGEPWRRRRSAPRPPPPRGGEGSSPSPVRPTNATTGPSPRAAATAAVRALAAAQIGQNFWAGTGPISHHVGGSVVQSGGSGMDNDQLGSQFLGSTTDPQVQSRVFFLEVRTPHQNRLGGLSRSPIRPLPDTAARN
jgi:hypothetical protein